MKPSPFVWSNGALISFEKAQVPLLTHTLHYGDGVFEGINVYDTERGPAMFRLTEHIDRLYESFSVFHKDIPYTKEELIQAIIDTVRANKIKHGYIRPLVYIGDGSMKLDIRDMPVHVTIATWQWDKHLGDKSVKTIISSFMRIHKKSLFVDKKIVGHYVNSILAHQEAKEKGYDEAILLDYQGAIAEGSAVNFFMVKDNVVQTPALGNILPGITRDCVLQIAQKLGIAIQELVIYPKDLSQATEAFFTGTATEISPIKSINEHIFGYEQIGDVTKRIKECFNGITRGTNNMFPLWLTFVE